MLKETETKETFCLIFFINDILIAGGLGPLPLPPGYAFDCNFNAICDAKILCAFLLVRYCLYAKATLIVLFCMIMLKM